MKITRLRLEQVRQFRKPLELRDIDAGLNLITGPNEAGKSTLVRAIRAAFFEKHRSMSVTDLQPFGDSAAAPSIELDFHTAGIHYQLKKSFLSRKRADLLVGTDRLSNDDAEMHLAELLGFAMASKGLSKAEQWGIPGLLWIEQGSGHEIHAAAGHAADHLRNALNTSLGEVTSTDGDDVLERLKAEREQLLTASTSRPTGAYKAVIEAMATERERMAELQGRIDEYRAQVDRLGAVQAELAADDAARPWEAFVVQRDDARARLAALQASTRELEAGRRSLVQVDRQLELLAEQARGFEAQARQAQQRRAEVEAARLQVSQAEEQLSPTGARLHAAQAAFEQAQVAAVQARSDLLLRSMATQLEEWRSRHEAVERSLEQAQGHDAELAALRKVAIANRIDAKDLSRWQAIASSLRDLHIRQEAVATRIEFAFEPGVRAELDGVRLEPSGEHRLTLAGELVIAGVGRLRIEPGGEDLAAMTAERRRLEAEQSELRMRLGVVDLAEAQAREATRLACEQDMRRVQALLAQVAPKGLDALRLEADELLSRIEGVVVKRQQMASTRGAQVHAAELATPTSVEDAERVATFASGQLEAARAAAQESQAALVGARSRLAHGQAELQAVEQVLQLAERASRVAANLADRSTTSEQRAGLHAGVVRLEAELAAAQPLLLQQDVERLTRSADQALAAQARRREESLRLQARLEEAGAQGLEEALAQTQAQAERTARRHAELSLRARALTLLVSLLEDKRRALTRRLQAPLQRHLDRHLQRLFPQASVTLDEHLSPGVLTRAIAGRDSETGDFHSLSFGAREQMALISRLAYADLLKEAGRPTLVILDDALVHSDATRLLQMKRILFDAATRHQVLLFTCHPDHWRDLGVAARSIESMRLGET